MWAHTGGATTPIAAQFLVMRGPHGCRLFASLAWPRHTGCMLEAIDIKYTRELLAGDTVALSQGDCVPLRRPYRIADQQI